MNSLRVVPRLYHYWRSTSSWRVRWALEIKGIRPEFIPLDLLTGESEKPEHRARNPMGYVPVLEVVDHGKTHFLSESVAIIEWLEEAYPKPALLPADPILKAHTRMLCEIINAGIQPLQNLSVTDYISENISKDEDARKKWMQHWIRNGLTAYETQVRSYAGKFSMGDSLTMAELFLMPQCYAAARNHVSLDEFPTIARIHESTRSLPDFLASHPDRFKP
jgi:maleylpyruvate isomerase